MNSISKETIIRTVVLVAALVNQALTIAGKSPLPFDDAAVTEFVSMVLTAGASLWSWWKNNSFTQSALAADAYMKTLKQAPQTGRGSEDESLY